MRLKHIRPFRHRVDDVLRALPSEGFKLISGTDTGWLGNGRYVLANDRESIRITRGRKEEDLDVAFCRNPGEEQWISLAELMVAVGELTFEEVIAHGVPHDLDVQLPAYVRIRPKIAAELGPNPTTHERLAQVRKQSQGYMQERYGRRAARAGESSLAYPKDVDCIWLAVDCDGHVAAFATGGAGPIPRSVLDDAQTSANLEPRILALPRTSAARTLVSYKRLDDFIAVAERGIFAYDWSDVHRTQLTAIGEYELIAVPSNPIQIADLSPDIAAAVMTCKLDRAFEGANRLDIRRLQNSVEG